MSPSRIIECPICHEHVVEATKGIPRKHYQKGTTGECPGGEVADGNAN